MYSLTEMIRRYSGHYNNRMKKLTNPLMELYGIPYFYFHEVKKDGRFFFITNKIEICEFHFLTSNFLENNIYTVCPSVMNEGLSDLDCYKFPGSLEVSKILEKNLKVEKLINIVRKTGQGYIVGSFGFPRKNKHFAALVGLDVLELQAYLTYFTNEIADILKKSEDNVADLQSIMGDNFKNPRYLLADLNGKENQYFRALIQKNTDGQQVPKFTEGELKCLKCCVDGLTARQIGTKLHIAKRTAEHQTDEIKIKLGCSKKSEINSAVQFLQRQGLLFL